MMLRQTMLMYSHRFVCGIQLSTTISKKEILLITLQDYTTKQIRTWGLGAFNNKQENVIYKSFKSEYELLNDFINWWMIEDNTPEVITGWNSKLYDIPYLCRRIDRILGEKLKKRMSPWGLVTEEETFIAGRKHISYDIGGVSQLDYLDLYKKFTYKAQESYRLDYIANVEPVSYTHLTLPTKRIV